MGTAVVPYDSDIKRKRWLHEGLVQKASTSFWRPYTGRSSSAIIYQVNEPNASSGHTVVFDYTGKISGRAVKGKETAFGKGEIKRIFSDKITVERYRLVVDNGDAFDGVDIGNLAITQHQDSRAKLADLFVRFKDQMIFDAAQGAIDNPPTHIYNLGTSFDYNDLLKIETALKTGKGFVKGSASGAITNTPASRRAPLEPYQLENGEPVWLFVIDSYMASKLKQSSNYQNLLMNADVRGNNNRLIKGLIGKLGRLLIVEAPDFFGYTRGQGRFGLEDSEIEIAGMRKYSISGSVGPNTTLSAWEGQAKFEQDAATPTKVYSRGLIMGQSAIQVAFGKMPDYKFQESIDFGITSQSAVEFWTAVKKTNLKLESGPGYKQAKIENIDYGVIAVDLQHT